MWQGVMVRAPAPRDVSAYVVTTYNDENEVLCNSFGGMGLYRAKNKILAENRAKNAKNRRK